MKVKRIIISVIAVLAVMGTMASCQNSQQAEPTNIEFSSVEEKNPELSLDLVNAEVKVGSSSVITPTIKNSDMGVKWASSNDKIATVDNTGKVTAVSEGTCKIICTSNEDESIKAESNITCTAIKVSKITASGVTLKEGSSAVIKASADSKATNKALTYKSSNTKLATVDQKGNVKGVKEGSCKIIITSKDGACTAEVTAKVTNKYGIKYYKNSKTVYSNSVNFYKTPSTKAELIQYLPVNTKIKVLCETPTWYLVQVGNTKGYVMREYTSATQVIVQYNNGGSNSNGYTGNTGGSNSYTSPANNYGGSSYSGNTGGSSNSNAGGSYSGKSNSNTGGNSNSYTPSANNSGGSYSSNSGGNSNSYTPSADDNSVINGSSDDGAWTPEKHAERMKELQDWADSLIWK